MKLISTYTESHKVFKDKWFLPSLRDKYDLELIKCPDSYGGAYMDKKWSKAVLFKADVIIETIKKNWGKVFIYSDIDIQFFQPTKKILLEHIVNNDIVCQRSNPYGQLCTGFWAAKANRKVLRIWEQVRKYIPKEKRDQLIFNKIIKREQRRKRLPAILRNIFYGNCRYSSLPTSFFGGGTLTGKRWESGMELFVPEDIVLHHADWTVGIESKIVQLEYVKRIVESRQRTVLEAES